MAVKMRLTRLGDKKSPFYRIVVVDSRKARDGEYIEKIGHYDPTKEPVQLVIDAATGEGLALQGRAADDTVRTLLIREGIIEKRPSSPRPAPGPGRRSNSFPKGGSIWLSWSIHRRQFAEHKEDIVYDVNERENAVDITVWLDESDWAR